MNAILRPLSLAGAAVALVASWGPAQAPEQALEQAGVVILARGPVHEAYAQPTQLGPQAPAEAAPKRPPSPIPELPPDQIPEGKNVGWVPGYWQWDSESNQFVWVSGVYRAAPPGRRWVPGYWTQTADGWQWVHGFWAAARQQDLTYLQRPPAMQEQIPAPAAADDNSSSVPGNWEFEQGQWVWRPGSLSAAPSDSVYVPSQFYWTPRGYVYVDGYRDYPLSNRGLLFAPVAFTQPLWTRPGWAYRPSYVVGPTPLLNSLWVRPAWGSYYFGNYYAAAYARAGFRPWYAYGASHYDPLFHYYRRQNLANPLWAAGLRNLYQDRAAGRAPLPPNTLAQQLALSRNVPGTIAVTRNSTQVLAPLNQASGLPGANVRLARLSGAQVNQLKANAQRVRDFGTQRGRVETARAGAGAVNRTSAAAAKRPAKTGAAKANAATGAKRKTTAMARKSATKSRTPAGASKAKSKGAVKPNARRPTTRTTHPPSRGASASRSRSSASRSSSPRTVSVARGGSRGTGGHH